MTGNHDVRVARAFHDATTHTPASIRTSGHTLEWDIKPFPFKVYTDLPTISLPRDVDLAEVDTLRALDPAARTEGQPLTLGRLAALLYLTAGEIEKRGERSEEHTSELQSQFHLVCRLLLEKKKKYKLQS